MKEKYEKIGLWKIGVVLKRKLTVHHSQKLQYELL